MYKAELLAVISVLSSSTVFATELLDIVLDSKISSMNKAGLGAVIYPHKQHEQWYECEECHPKLFIAKIGANDIDMEKNITDQFCGAAGCHNSAYAFPLYLCEECHTKAEKVENR